MKKIIIFEAEDGTRFNTEERCLKYEAVLDKVSDALVGIWHPGNENEMFNTGRQAIEHPKGTRQRLAASLLPVFTEAIPTRRAMDDTERLQWLFSYFFDNPSAWPCLRGAHKRLMSMDALDREWCDPSTCMEKSRWAPAYV